VFGELADRYEEQDMRCPYCSHPESSVLESRVVVDQTGIRRRRQCARCGKRFTTYERVEGLDLSVVKKNGERQSFDREKIRKGLMKATWKRPVSIEQIEQLLDDVERKLRLKESTEVKSWEVGNLVMNRLRKIDPVSYILFASVYRDFQTVEELEEEINKLHGDESKAQEEK